MYCLLPAAACLFGLFDPKARSVPRDFSISKHADSSIGGFFLSNFGQLHKWTGQLTENGHSEASEKDRLCRPTPRVFGVRGIRTEKGPGLVRHPRGPLVKLLAYQGTRRMSPGGAKEDRVVGGVGRPVAGQGPVSVGAGGAGEELVVLVEARGANAVGELGLGVDVDVVDHFAPVALVVPDLLAHRAQR